MNALDQLGQAVADATEEAERALLCELWLSTGPTYSACVEAGLTGSHFSRAVYSLQYAYLCLCHENGIEPHPYRCLWWAEHCGIYSLELYDLKQIIGETMTDPDRREWYAGNVIGFAEQRQRTAQALAAYAAAVGDGRYQIKVTMAPKVQARGR